MKNRATGLLVHCLLVLTTHLFGPELAVAQEITVIVHGRQQSKTMPDWPTDLAVAINANQPKPAPIFAVRQSIVGASGKLPEEAAANFIVYDWAANSYLAGTADDLKVIEPLASCLIRQVNKQYERTGLPVNVKLIGHSRGAYVLCAMLRFFHQKYPDAHLGFVHLVLLDPQDLVDPRTFNSDGELEANPGGIVDWTTNFYQTNDRVLGGKTVPGALNIDLSSVITAWQTFSPSLTDHQKVADYFFWTQDQDDSTDPENSSYKDSNFRAEEKQFYQEYRENNRSTRQLLYSGTYHSPLIENFNTSEVLFFNQIRAQGNPQSKPKIVESLAGVNELKNHALQMTVPKPWVGSSLLAKQVVEGDCVIEFSFRCQPQKGSVVGAGLTCAIVDANYPGDPIGSLGPYLGYGGMHGLAIAFDSHADAKLHEEEEVTSQVTVRVNGSVKGQDIFGLKLPEPINKGNWFRVRIETDTNHQALNLTVYSAGRDKLVHASGKVPANGRIPKLKTICFTAATGDGVESGVQTTTLDDIIIAPR